MQHWYTQKNEYTVWAIFTILYGNYYPSHGKFKLICIGKFDRRTWMNFTQHYGKNRQSCQQYKFYYAVWQLLLYYYREFPSKILSVYVNFFLLTARKLRISKFVSCNLKFNVEFFFNLIFDLFKLKIELEIELKIATAKFWCPQLARCK